MTTLVFELLGGLTETPAPDATGAGSLRLTGRAYGPTIEELGGAGYGRLRLLQGPSTTGVVEEPTFGIGVASLVLVPGYCYGAGIEAPATGDGTLRLTGAFAGGVSGFEASDVGSGTLRLYGLGVGGGAIEAPDGGYDAVFMLDAIAFDITTTTTPIALLLAELTLIERAPTRFDGVRSIADNLALEAALTLIFHNIMEDSAEFGATDTVDYRAIALMVDALILENVVNTYTEALNVITEAMTFGAVIEGFPRSTMLSELEIGADLAVTYTAMVELIDGLLAGAECTTVATLTVAVSDALGIDVAVTTAAEFIAAIRDGLNFVLRLSVDNEEYIAWAMNADSKGLSTYTNYPFNSFMKLGGIYYGVSDTGIFRLNGDDDDGTDIDAMLRLGMDDLGTRFLKGVPNIYVGYTSDGDMLFKTVVANQDTGARTAYTHLLKANAAVSLREGRVQPGRGIESVYWDCIVENVDGAAFELDSIEFKPIASSRRVRRGGR